MRFVRGDVKDHIVSHKTDHGPAHRRYRALQQWRCLKICFCEIFGIVRFSTFATISATSKLMHRSKRRPPSITSSARARRIGGTARPSALAILTLITSSYFVAACTGRSAGFSPLRIRSM